jgi:hypothetical protein
MLATTPDEGRVKMAKILVMHDLDPCISITLREVPEGGPNAGDLWGTCTECPFTGQWSTRERAVSHAQRHVDGHEPILIGGDLGNLVR